MVKRWGVRTLASARLPKAPFSLYRFAKVKTIRFTVINWGTVPTKIDRVLTSHGVTPV